MRLKHVFKVWLRARSLSFTLNIVRPRRSKSLAALKWRGRKIFYRPGSSDGRSVYQNLLRTGKKAEYHLPRGIDPKIILDIGSNIGASILYFHRCFPSARIFGFEPHPETFQILQRNIADLPLVSVNNFGLADVDATVTVRHDPIDFSAVSTKPEMMSASPAASRINCEVKHAGHALRELGIDKVDLIKIDCEGAEYDAMSAIPEEVLTGCKWIVGEMHDPSGFKLLELLASRFDLDLRKGMFEPRFRFHACNRAYAKSLDRTFDLPSLQI
jgi:FkbM family methyltransferase